MLNDEDIQEIAELTDAIKNDRREVDQKPDDQTSGDPVRVYLWADPDQEGVYYDQPIGAGEGYRKAKKYSEADKQALERAIGEAVEVIRP